MKTLNDQLIQYARYHRDPRNIATHFIGIPMITLAIAVLLSRPSWGVVSPALVLAAAFAVYYLVLDLRYGLAMSALLAAALWAASDLASGDTARWLAWGVGLFVVGWIFQFVGHWWEGRKPAFVDDLIGLVIGPLFVVAEAGFRLGWRREVEQAVEAAAGPVARRDQRTLAPEGHG
ncbi:MAG: DUF962 domain-containing protein [Burkholderiales bacterium]|nr:DUF962 domain-containing protein [Burkholderiales bacterium]